MTCARSFSSNSASAFAARSIMLAQRLRQQVAVQARFQQIILCAPLNRELGDILVLRSAEDQDRNLRRQAKEAVEGLDSAAVGQEEVHEHRRYGIHWLPSRLAFLGEALQALGAEPHPFDLESAIARVDERLSNRLGVPAIVLDQKYGFRHDTIERQSVLQNAFEPSHREAVCAIAYTVHSRLHRGAGPLA